MLGCHSDGVARTKPCRSVLKAVTRGAKSGSPSASTGATAGHRACGGVKKWSPSASRSAKPRKRRLSPQHRQHPRPARATHHPRNRRPQPHGPNRRNPASCNLSQVALGLQLRRRHRSKFETGFIAVRWCAESSHTRRARNFPRDEQVAAKDRRPIPPDPVAFPAKTAAWRVWP